MRAPQTGDLFGGKYRLARPLAQGGMGSVWVAEHLTLGKAVAVKLMAPDALASPALRARFEREAKAAAQLTSPHVVTVHDYGVEGDVPYIVMELLEGEDLGARLRRARRLSLPDAIAIAVPVAKALSRAHGAGVVHRDLKPSNVFLARVAEDEIVKVLDFGIAKAALGPRDAETTSGDALLGSPSYMSPEQVRGARDVDHRTDLWSFAVILFRMLTGSMPFRSHASGDLLVRICTDPVPSASRIAPELPPEIDAFFERALAKETALRFESATALVGALMAIASPGSAFAPASARAPFPSVPTDPHGGATPNATHGRTPLEPGTLTEAGSQVTPRDQRAHPRTITGVVAAAAAFAVVLGVWAMLRGHGSTSAETPRTAASVAPAIDSAPPAATQSAPSVEPASPSIEPVVPGPEPSAEPAAPMASAPQSPTAAPTGAARAPAPRRPTSKPSRLPLGL